MPPKPKYSRDQIVDAAFEVACEEGISGITIRKIGERLGSSVAPVYVNFADAEELRCEVVKRVARLSAEMLSREDSGKPMRDLGAASVRFAAQYPVLVRDLLCSANGELQRYGEQADAGIVSHMARDPELSGLSEGELRRLLLKLRVFHTGITVAVANGHLPAEVGEEETIKLMHETAAELMRAAQKDSRKDSEGER